MADENRLTRIYVAIILIGFFVTILPNIGTRDLWEPEELRYAEVSREMMSRGDWALLRINNKLYPDKPPLFFWLICASAKCFGGLNAITVRVPNITSSFLLLLVVFLFGRRLIGERPAFLACLALMSTPFFVWTCAEARMDTTLTLFIALALWCFWRNYEKGGRNIPLHLAFGILTGLATLTKGPIGFLLPFLTALVFTLKERQPRKLLNLTFLPAIGACLAVVLPWLILACYRGGEDFTRNILFTQNIGRAVLGIRHSKPFYHFFWVVPGILMPWTLLIPAMIYYRPFAEDEKTRRGQIFVLCWFLTVFIFFTLSKGKRTIYMTPLLPAAGLLFGAALDRFIEGESSGRPQRGMRWTLGGIALLLPVICLVVPVAVHFVYPDYLRWALAILWATAIGSVAACVLFFTGRRVTCLFVVMGTIGASWFLASVIILPRVNEEKSAKVLLDHAATIIDKDKEPLAVYASKRLGYAVYWGKDIPVLERLDDLFDYLSAPGRVFCIARKRDFPESPIFVGDKGYIMWQDTCGYREHVLVSNRIKYVPLENVQLFEKAHADAQLFETGQFTMLLSGAVPKPGKEGVDIDLECTGDRVLFRFFPAECDHVISVRFRFRGFDADRVVLSALPLAKGPSPVQWEVVPHSSPMAASFFFQKPCGALVRQKKEGE
ncbi:MAG: glycosyltransferase family 39 protein [Planctomycetes bacterium]|nr:glycosyltransferase family 39 protein [Planctomycetota bacterium]